MQASAHDLAVFAAQVLQSPRTVTCAAQVEPPSRVSVRAHAGDDYEQTISHLTEVAAHQPTAPIPIMGAIDDRGELTLVDMESGKLMASVKDSLISGDAPLCMCALPSDVHETLGVFVTVHASGKAAVWTMCREPPIAMCWRAHKTGTGIHHVRAWLEPDAAARTPAHGSAPGAAAPGAAGQEPDQPCAPGDRTRAIMKRLRIMTVPGHFDGESPDSRPIAAHAKCWMVDFAGAASRAMPRTPRGAGGVVRVHHNGWTPQQMWKSRTPGVRALQVAVCSMPQVAAPPAAIGHAPESGSTSAASRNRAISPDPWAGPGEQPSAAATAAAAGPAQGAVQPASADAGSAHKHGKWGKLMGNITKKSIHWMHGAAKAMDSKAEAAQRRTEQGVGAGMSDKLLSGMRGVTQPAVSGLSSMEQSAQAQAATVSGPASGTAAAAATGGPKFGMLLSNSDGRFTLLRPTPSSSAQQIDPDHEGRCALHNVAVLDLWADQELEQLHQVGAVWPTAGSVAVTLDEYTGTVHALHLAADGSAGFQLAHCYSQAGVLPAGHHSFIPLRLLIRRDGTLDTHSIPGPMWLARNNVTGAVLLCCVQCRESDRGLEPVRISTTQLGCGGTEWLKHAAETHIHAVCVLDVSAGTGRHPGVLLGAEVLLAVRGVAEQACLHGHDTRALAVGGSAAASAASSDTTIAAESAIISADTGPGSLVFSRRILSTEQVLLAVQPPAGVPQAVGAQHELGHSPRGALAALPAEVGMAAWLAELQKQLERSMVGKDAPARACKWNAWQDQAAVLHSTSTATWQQPDGSSILALQSLPAVFWPPWPAPYRWTLDKNKQRQRAELQNHATCAPGGGPVLPEATSMFRHTLQSRIVPTQLATIPALHQGLLKPGHPVAVDVGKVQSSSSEPPKYLLSELPAKLGATAPAATLPATLVDGWLGALEAHARDAVPSWLVRARREVERLLRLHAMRRQEALDEPPLLLCLQACSSGGDSTGPGITISTPWFIQTRGHVPSHTLTDDSAARAAELAGSPHSHESSAEEAAAIRRAPTPLQRTNPGALNDQAAVQAGAGAKASRWGQALGTLPINDVLQLLEHAHPELAQLPAMCNVQVLTLVPPISVCGSWSLGVLGVSMTCQPIPLLFPLHEAGMPAATSAAAPAGAAAQPPAAVPIHQVLLPLPADMAEPGMTRAEVGLADPAAPERATPLPSPTPEHGQPLPCLPGCGDAMQVWDVYTPGQAAVTSRMLLGPCDGTELHCWRLAPDGAWKTMSFCPFSSAEGSISRALVVPGPPASAAAAPGASAAMPAPGGTYLAVVSTFGKVKILDAYGHTVHHFDTQYAIPVTDVAALPVAGTLWPCLAVVGEPTRVASTSALQVVECWDIWRTQLIERWHPVHAGGVSAIPTDAGGEPAMLTHEAPGIQLEEVDLTAHRTVWLCA